MGPHRPDPVDDAASFDAFVVHVEPLLRRALVARFGSERGREATAEALAFAWEKWERVQGLHNPVAYLFTVGRSRTKRRHPVARIFERPDWTTTGDFEPKLAKELGRLSDRQRVAVVLVVGFGWTMAETAALLGIQKSSVQNHVERGMRHLVSALGASDVKE